MYILETFGLVFEYALNWLKNQVKIDRLAVKGNFVYVDAVVQNLVLDQERNFPAAACPLQPAVV